MGVLFIQNGCLVYSFSVKPTLTAFRRLIYHPPFPDIAKELFDYLSETIFQDLKSDLSKELIASVDVSRAIKHSEFLISLVKDLDILHNFKNPPVSCMYIIERYMTNKTLTLALTLESESDLRTFKRSRDIINLTKALRRWELKQTNFSSTPWP
ncbi:MAG: hypothetical protein N0C88_21775 [Candidatus Thiodiazotropha lotti]|uniref:Uncharacterized protein n=1 Tax=Candidatus Thiodiazotropha lotti TaxID=2792787 RepID=A0A9E4K9X5_9GAMM|nr:hypothetical protein [Candidatus Thiodiazotropha lotti]MCW4205935.1 hypothetical protein [Candidatus Thiodiazotropha lotti]